MNPSQFVPDGCHVKRCFEPLKIFSSGRRDADCLVLRVTLHSISFSFRSIATVFVSSILISDKPSSLQPSRMSPHLVFFMRPVLCIWVRFSAISAPSTVEHRFSLGRPQCGTPFFVAKPVSLSSGCELQTNLAAWVLVNKMPLVRVWPLTAMLGQPCTVAGSLGLVVAPDPSPPDNGRGIIDKLRLHCCFTCLHVR